MCTGDPEPNGNENSNGVIIGTSTAASVLSIGWIGFMAFFYCITSLYCIKKNVEERSSDKGMYAFVSSIYIRMLQSTS